MGKSTKLSMVPIHHSKTDLDVNSVYWQIPPYTRYTLLEKPMLDYKGFWQHAPGFYIHNFKLEITWIS